MEDRTSMTVVEAARRVSNIMAQHVDPSIIKLLCEKDEIPHSTIPARDGRRVDQYYIDEEEIDNIVGKLLGKEEEPKLLSTKEAAECLGCTPGYLTELSRKGKLNAVEKHGQGGRNGVLLYFYEKDIETLMAKREAGHKKKRGPKAKPEKVEVRPHTRDGFDDTEEVLRVIENNFKDFMDSTRARLNDIYELGYKKGREDENKRIVEAIAKGGLQ